jgi:hypothetical protein
MEHPARGDDWATTNMVNVFRVGVEFISTRFKGMVVTAIYCPDLSQDPEFGQVGVK